MREIGMLLEGRDGRSRVRSSGVGVCGRERERGSERTRTRKHSRGGLCVEALHHRHRAPPHRSHAHRLASRSCSVARNECVTRAVERIFCGGRACAESAGREGWSPRASPA